MLWLQSMLASIVIVGTTVAAHSVPLPRPSPLHRTAVASAAQARAPIQVPTQTIQPLTVVPPQPVLPDARFKAGNGKALVLNADQQALAAKISAYLSSLQSLSGNFVQVGPDGTRTTGNFFMQKPGKVRFTYDPPTPIDIVADGSSLIVRDRKLATQDLYPLSQTPLRFLLAEHVDLTRDSHLVGLYADDVFVTAVIEEKQAMIGTSRLMLMLSATDMQLKQWTVTDPQGYDTTVAVYNLDTTRKLDSSMFKIDYTSYHN